MGTSKLTKNEARTCGILVHYLFDMMASFKKAIVENRPTVNQREFKQINRLCDSMLKIHESDMTYKLDEWHRRDLESGCNLFAANIAMTQTKLYFQIRNEVINTDLPESCHEPVIYARMLELTINIVDSIAYEKHLYISKKFVLILDVLKALCSDWEDKGNQQALCKKVIQLEVERMLNEENEDVA